MVPNTTWRVAAAAALAAALLAALPACGASDAEVRLARTSGYKADFAVVYSETLAAVRELYPNIVEEARTGIIRTAWHPLRVSTGTSEDTGTQASGTTSGQLGGGLSMQTQTSRTTYFARFTVVVAGGRPWRVRVSGEASVWKAGEVPSPLRGGDLPPWLPAREDALRLAIYERLKAHAVPLRIKSSDDAAPPVEDARAAGFAALPAAARPVLLATLRAAEARDAATVRRHMADDFAWAPGAAPSADVALATWQADTDVFIALGRAIAGGCALAAERITCRENPPPADGRRAVFAQVGGAWRLVEFVAPE